jgi:hypothetical protein
MGMWKKELYCNTCGINITEAQRLEFKDGKYCKDCGDFKRNNLLKQLKEVRK